MRKIAILAGFFAAMPLAAQQPAPPPAPAPATGQPTLEKPQMAEPEAAPAKPKTAPAPVAKPKTTGEENGRVVEEIIARVNNDIITKSEYDKALGSVVEDAKQECENRCTPQQLETSIEDRRKNALRDLIDQLLGGSQFSQRDQEIRITDASNRALRCKVGGQFEFGQGIGDVVVEGVDVGHRLVRET